MTNKDEEIGTGSLPQGWVRTTLDSILYDTGKSIEPSKTPDTIFELYSVPSHETATPEIVRGSGIGSNKQTVIADTVLLCKINPRINRVWVVSDSTGRPQIASTEWIPFSPVSGIAPSYLAYFMRQHKFRDFLAANASGVGGSLTRVKPSTLVGFPFVVAPLPEQVRIVAEIERLFSLLDAGVANLKRVRANLKRYRASVLQAACTGKLVPTEAELAHAERCDYEPADVLLQRILAERRARWEADQLAKMRATGKEPKDDKWKAKYEEPVAPRFSETLQLPQGWTWGSVEQLNDACRPVSYGVLKPGDFVTDGIPMLRILDMKSGVASVENAHRISQSLSDEYKRTLLSGGEILISLVGTIGITAFVPSYLAGANVHRNLGVMPFTDLVAIKYIRRSFESFVVQQQVRDVTTGANQPLLNLGEVRRLAIPLPPLVEQGCIIAEVERRLSVVDALETTVKQNLKRAERLRQAILRDAFAGKLVPQDPSDEPASILLARIEAERAATTEAANTRRTTKDKEKLPDGRRKQDDPTGKGVPPGVSRRKRDVGKTAQVQPDLFSTDGP